MSGDEIPQYYSTRRTHRSDGRFMPLIYHGWNGSASTVHVYESRPRMNMNINTQIRFDI